VTVEAETVQAKSVDDPEQDRIGRPYVASDSEGCGSRREPGGGCLVPGGTLGVPFGPSASTPVPDVRRQPGDPKDNTGLRSGLRLLAARPAFDGPGPQGQTGWRRLIAGAVGRKAGSYLSAMGVT